MELESATCDCPGVGGGFRLDVESGLWVHAACGKPTQMYLDAMYQRALEA